MIESMSTLSFCFFSVGYLASHIWEFEMFHLINKHLQKKQLTNPYQQHGSVNPHGMTEAAAHVICRETGHTYAVDWFGLDSDIHQTLQNLASKMIVILNVHCGRNAVGFRECRYKVNQTWNYGGAKLRKLLGLVCNPSPGF